VANLAQERSEEGHTCGANFLYHTRFAGGLSAYICGLQKDEWRIGYTQFAVEKTTYVRGSSVGEAHI
jgi:hypothetical protein